MCACIIKIYETKLLLLKIFDTWTREYQQQNSDQIPYEQALQSDNLF